MSAINLGYNYNKSHNNIQYFPTINIRWLVFFLLHRRLRYFNSKAFCNCQSRNSWMQDKNGNLNELRGRIDTSCLDQKVDLCNNIQKSAKWQQDVEVAKRLCYNLIRETKAGRLTLFCGGNTLQTKERRAIIWWHILIWFSFVYLWLPLLVCFIRFSRGQKNKPPHLAHVTATR